MNWTYLIVGGFFVEVITEMFKKLLNLEGGEVLLIAIIVGIVYSLLTPQETIKYQLNWKIWDWSSILITGVIVSSFAKFYDYIFKYTNLKSKNQSESSN